MEKELTSDKFNKFIKCLSLLKDHCDDVDINNGFIRQRTNSFSCILELDLNPIIGDLTIPLTSIKNMINLFKTFNKCDVKINVNNRSFSFEDNFSRITFKRPNSNFINNKFITPEEYGNIIQFNPEDLILTCNVDNIITNRIKKISQIFDMNSVKIIFENNMASITSMTQSKDQEAELIRNLEINGDLVRDGNVNITTVPFIIDHDDFIKMNIYNDDDKCVCFFEMKYNDININVSTSSPLLCDDDDF